MNANDFMVIAITAVVSGLVCSIGTTLLTVAALRVHIDYLRNADDKHDAAITRAHARIDGLQDQIRDIS